MADQKHTGCESETVAVRLTPTLDSDYARRGVFQSLRPAGVEGAVTLRVGCDVAQQMLNDARLQHQRAFGVGERGVKKAYGHLINALRRALEPEAVADEERRDTIARSATQFHVPRKSLQGLQVQRYGLRLLNAYGSRAQLIEAGFLPRDFVFPLTTETNNKRWSDGDIDYLIAPRHQSMADQAAQIYGDHYWFQVLDRRHPYPDGFAQIWKAEIDSGSTAR